MASGISVLSIFCDRYLTYLGDKEGKKKKSSNVESTSTAKPKSELNWNQQVSCSLPITFHCFKENCDFLLILI